MLRHVVTQQQQHDAQTVERPSALLSSDLKYLQSKEADIVRALHHHVPDLTSEECDQLLLKLADYRVVHRICDLQKGRYKRWIKSGNKKLEKGGIMMNINFTDSHPVVLCQVGPSRRQFVNFRFDECLAFERLSDNDLVLLAHL